MSEPSTVRAQPDPLRRRLRLRWSFVDDLRRASPVIRLLVLTQMAFNIGFFMVLPYLSVHLTGSLGLTAATVGVVLGLRTFSQQGLFVVGGSLADRWGIKPVVLVGCVLRILGFVVMAASTSLWGVIVATLLIGFAAALFSPAVESAVAIEAGVSENDGGAPRVESFALLTVCGQIGSFTGPLIGSLLLLVNFRAACLAAAAVFFVVICAHLRWLPRRPGDHRGESLLSGWREVMRNRLFLLFAVAMSAQLVAYNQLYLLLPLEVERASGSQAPLGWFFAISAAFVVVSQMAVTRRSGAVSPRVILPVGFGIMALSFVLVAATSPLALRGVLGLLPAGAFVLLLALGQMIAMPPARDLVARLAGERRLGAHYGFMASLGGVAVLISSVLVGAAIDAVPDTGWGTTIPWLVAAFFPLTAIAGVRGVLTRLPAHPTG